MTLEEAKRLRHKLYFLISDFNYEVLIGWSGLFKKYELWIDDYGSSFKFKIQDENQLLSFVYGYLLRGEYEYQKRQARSNIC